MRGKYVFPATFQPPKYLVGKIDHPLAGSGFQAHVHPRDSIGTLGSGEGFPVGEHSVQPFVHYFKSKHLKACLGPVFVTVLDPRGLTLAFRL